ncbi:MAG: DUF971 domain-containing protein [Rhodospirillales bacterium]|jgi:prepilin-type processing-associated H-X9-DG protein|nr:DUF971 domain-containing protein [Rhodospirillales bacterium]
MQDDLLQAAVPDTVAIGEDGRVLIIDQAGTRRRLAAARLRRACRCAGCRAAGLLGTPIEPDAAVRIAKAAPIGGYALNLAFTDGHARGVFPFVYLASLAAEAVA